jgi:hypothetical protein
VAVSLSIPFSPCSHRENIRAAPQVAGQVGGLIAPTGPPLGPAGAFRSTKCGFFRQGPTVPLPWLGGLPGQQTAAGARYFVMDGNGTDTDTSSAVIRYLSYTLGRAGACIWPPGCCRATTCLCACLEFQWRWCALRAFGAQVYQESYRFSSIIVALPPNGLFDRCTKSTSAGGAIVA